MIAIGRYGGGNNIVDRVETVYPYASGYSIFGSQNIGSAKNIRGVVRKERDYMGKVPKLRGGGSDPYPLLDVYSIQFI